MLCVFKIGRNIYYQSGLFLPWMAVYDSTNYTRYMSIYWVEMYNLNEDAKSYMEKGLFTASLTGLPFSTIPHDQWIEMTMNKDSKMKGGWIGFTKNESMVNIHTHAVNDMVQIRDALHSRASLKSTKQNHAANSKSRLKTDEQKVQYIIACLLEWDVNPWDKDKNILRSLESEFLSSKVLIADFISAKNYGEIQIVKYFEERIKSSEKLITQTIPRNKRYTFQMPPAEVGHECKAPKRTDAMESKALTALIQAAQKSAIDLEQVMKYRVTDISLPLFNLDGTIRKSHEIQNYKNVFILFQKIYTVILLLLI